ncbi:MAG: BTAD domain-containing putative transcriptional regulator [Anaerolineae bacterium]
MPRAQLCYLFWPDVPDATARRNLTRLLVLVRSSLPRPTLLVTEDEIVTLDREQVASDTVEFVRLISAMDSSVRRETLRSAVDLYRGPFLDGFALPDAAEFESWMEEERRTWERRVLDTLAALIEVYSAERDYTAAIAFAERYLQHDELAEDIHRRLIALYAALGDRTAALRQFERCAVALERELGVSPLPETRAVFEAVREGAIDLPGLGGAAFPATVVVAQPAPAEPPRPAALPTPTSPLVGRTTEIAEVAALLRRAEVRLVTLNGSGGSGKTRLAIEAARFAGAGFADDVAFVPLAPLRDAALVIPAITEALGLTDLGDRPPLARLQDALQDREMLLVLDNFEHVAEAAVDVAALLAAAPRLTILTTSRARLHIAGEHSYPVSPLALADAAHLPALDALAQVDAVALFLARVRMRTPDFRLTETNARDVAAICARLDGLPLAIELAAARMALLSPRTLLARLDQRLALLTGGPHDLPERQRTLRATIDWSYNLLDLSAQMLFERLAVFAGSWGLEAAEAVAGAVGPLATRVLDGLQALLDKHLIQRASDVGGEPRYTMLETIREYALERLADRGEADVAQQAHARYCLALAEAAAPQLHGPQQIGWFDRLDEEHANLRVALAWLLEKGDVADALRLACALHWFWHVRGHYAEGRTWLEQALAATPTSDPPIPAPLVAQAHGIVSHLAIDQGDAAAALPHAEQSLALWRDLERDSGSGLAAPYPLLLAIEGVLHATGMQGDHSQTHLLVPELVARIEAAADPWLDAWLTFSHGAAVLENFGDIAFAQEKLTRAQALFDTLGDTYYQAHVLAWLGLLAIMQGDPAAARASCERALAEAGRLKERTLEAQTLDRLGDVARLTGADDQAAGLYASSLSIYRDLDNRLGVARVTHNLGYLALHTGKIELARRRFSASLRGFQSLGQPRGQAEGLAGLAAVVAEGRTIPSARLAARWWAAAATAHAAEGSPIWPADQAEHERHQALARATLGSRAFDAAYAEGASLSLDEAVAEALRL